MGFTISFLFLFFAASAFAAPNMIVNGEFRNGFEGFGFSDGAPEEVGARLEPNGDGSHILTYRAKDGEWGGLNLSEVKLERDKAYILSFSARTDKPARLKLIAFANGESIFRQNLAFFETNEKWTTVSHKICTKNTNLADWVPFRIERDGGGDAEISVAAFKLGEEGQIVEEPRFASKIILKPNDGKEKSSKKKSRAPAPNSMIFSKNSSLTAVANFTNNTGAKRRVNVEWKISHATLDESYESSQKILVAGGKTSREISIKAPPKNGLYNIEFKIDGADSDMASFAITPVARAPKGTMPIDVGYCGVITDGEFGKPSPDEIEFLADSGIAYIRTWDTGNPFNWRVIEPEEGKYKFDVADETLALAKKNNLEILPVLGGMFFTYPDKAYWRQHRQADWLYAKSEVVPTIDVLAAQGRHAIKPPLADWERMVRTVAERYKGKIRQYEIMNEPNIVWEDKKTYFPYLEAAYKILKSTDPKIKVVGLSTTGDFGANINGFVGTMMKMGAGKYMDAVSFHSYNAVYEDSRKRGDVVMADFKRDMEKFGVKVPLWNSELYYLNPESESGTSGRMGATYHAGYLARRYLVDIESGVEVSTPLPAGAVATTYPLGGQTFLRFANGRKMSLQSVQKTAYVPSEKYIVSAVFARQLSNTKYLGRTFLKDEWLCYKFENKKTGRAVGVIFALFAKMENLDFNQNPRTRLVDTMNREPLDFSADAEEAKFLDVFGNEIKPENGSLKLAPSPIPVYIRAADAASLNMVLNKFRTQ